MDCNVAIFNLNGSNEEWDFQALFAIEESSSSKELDYKV